MYYIIIDPCVNIYGGIEYRMRGRRRTKTVSPHVQVCAGRRELDPGSYPATGRQVRLWLKDCFAFRIRRSGIPLTARHPCLAGQIYGVYGCWRATKLSRTCGNSTPRSECFRYRTTAPVPRTNNGSLIVPTPRRRIISKIVMLTRPRSLTIHGKPPKKKKKKKNRIFTKKKPEVDMKT